MSTMPMLTLRAKTQLVTQGITRYMGELFVLPQPVALGYVGAGEVEQVVDVTRPLTWENNAPGPHESWQQFGDPQTQGSREGAIGGGQAGPRGGTPGDQQTRQIAGQNTATFLRAQQYDDYRNVGTAGLEGPTGQWWQEGAVEGGSGISGGGGGVLISPLRAGVSGEPTGFAGRNVPPVSRRPMPPQRRPPGFTPPRPPGREERRDDRDDRREARHERREERYDQRHEERHERREDRYDRRHEARDDRGEARHERRDERGDREAHHPRRDERGDRDRHNEREGRRHGGGK